MKRIEQIREWVSKYELGYYFNPGGVEFFCPAFPDIEHCQCSEYVGEEGEYQDDEDFNKLTKWIEDNKEKLNRSKPSNYTYYSEGIITVKIL